MGQNNIEHQIKEKLNAREIQPSAQAWGRLDAMLTVAEQKKTKRFPFWFIGIAASVLVLLTVGLFFFNQEKTVIAPTNDVVVVPDVEKTIINNEQQLVEQNQVTSTENKSTVNNPQSTINNQRVSIISQKNNQKNNQNSVINRRKEIEYLVSGDVAAVKSMPKFIVTDPVIVQQKTQDVAKMTSYVDVSILLASVEGELKVQPKSNKIKVDATTLLSHADGEVEQTFREKVINSVSKNFKEVKVALSNRNKE